MSLSGLRPHSRTFQAVCIANIIRHCMTTILTLTQTGCDIRGSEDGDSDTGNLHSWLKTRARV